MDVAVALETGEVTVSFDREGNWEMPVLLDLTDGDIATLNAVTIMTTAAIDDGVLLA